MKRFIKVVQVVSVSFLVGAPLYLSNQGDLGVNLTTILATATPTTILIVTGLYDLLQLVLPKMVAVKVWNVLVEHLGQANADKVKEVVNDVGAPILVENVLKLVQDLDVIKDTVLSIKEEQDKVL